MPKQNSHLRSSRALSSVSGVPRERYVASCRKLAISSKLASIIVKKNSEKDGYRSLSPPAIQNTRQSDGMPGLTIANTSPSASETPIGKSDSIASASDPDMTCRYD